MQSCSEVPAQPRIVPHLSVLSRPSHTSPVSGSGKRCCPSPGRGRVFSSPGSKKTPFPFLSRAELKQRHHLGIPLPSPELVPALRFDSSRYVWPLPCAFHGPR